MKDIDRQAAKVVAARERIEKIKALAATGDYNPHEAANALDILSKMPVPTLDRIAVDIKSAWDRGVEAQFEVGRLLVLARAEFPDTQGFGSWMQAQEFPFGRRTAGYLREAAEREPEVRAFIADRQLSAGRDIGPVTAMKYMNATPKPVAAIEAYAPVDPAYDALRTAYNLILQVVDGEPTGNAFLTMHVDDLGSSAARLREIATAYNEAAKARNNG